jgi:CheY-like chemotaxis protein
MNVAIADRLSQNQSVKTPCILAVEDDEDNLLLISYLLEQYKCSFLTARDGLTALELIKEHHPDLILLDIVLPKLNGMELIGRLKQERSTSKIPIIAITGLASATHRARILDAGCQDCFVKPYPLDELEKSIDKNLRLSSEIAQENNRTLIEK